MKVAEVGALCTGICYAHETPRPATATIVSGAAASSSEFQTALARVGDQVITDCGHTGMIVTGNALVSNESMLLARVGDQVTGQFIGMIVASDGTVDA